MVYTIGESVLDIIIKNFDDAKIKPGGSMLNSAISLGRLGVPVNHISFLSLDKSSEFLINFLKNNKVNTSYIHRKAIKTNLALAYLDENNNADYVFYKEKLDNEIEFNFPEINKEDIILFGSLFCLNMSYRESLMQFLRHAKSVGTLIIYDPNFRKPHLPELDILYPLIEENFQIADVVKGSDEDFMNILKKDKGQDVWTYLANFKTKALLYTKGADGVVLYTPNCVVSESSNQVEVSSTIGAGDTFSAGVIYSLVKNDYYSENFNDISEVNWKTILETANTFAAEVCTSFENYLSNEFIRNRKDV